MHGHEGPEYALITTLMADGRRALSKTDDNTLMESMMEEEYVGLRASVNPEGKVNVFSA